MTAIRGRLHQAWPLTTQSRHPQACQHKYDDDIQYDGLQAGLPARTKQLLCIACSIPHRYLGVVPYATAGTNICTSRPLTATHASTNAAGATPVLIAARTGALHRDLLWDDCPAQVVEAGKNLLLIKRHIAQSHSIGIG